MEAKKLYTVADVKCYHCGHVTGELTVEKGKPPQSGWFTPSTGCSTASGLKNGRLRCGRCNGPVYLDEVRTVRPRPTYTEIRPRRGRPRRVDVIARAG